MNQLLILSIVYEPTLRLRILVLYLLYLFNWVLDSWLLSFSLLLWYLPVYSYVASCGSSLVHLHVVDLNLTDIAAANFDFFAMSQLVLVGLLLDVHDVPILLSLSIFNSRGKSRVDSAYTFQLIELVSSNHHLLYLVAALRPNIKQRTLLIITNKVPNVYCLVSNRAAHPFNIIHPFDITLFSLPKSILGSLSLCNI